MNNIIARIKETDLDALYNRRRSLLQRIETTRRAESIAALQTDLKRLDKAILMEYSGHQPF